jgi:hypothetical protein
LHRSFAIGDETRWFEHRVLPFCSGGQSLERNARFAGVEAKKPAALAG